MKILKETDVESLLHELRLNMRANQLLHMSNRRVLIERNYWKNVAMKHIDEIEIQDNYAELRNILSSEGFVEKVYFI